MMSLLHGPLSGEERVRKRAWVLMVALGAFLLLAGGAGALGLPDASKPPPKDYAYRNGKVIIGGDVVVPCRSFDTEEKLDFYPENARGEAQAQAERVLEQCEQAGHVSHSRGAAAEEEPGAAAEEDGCEGTRIIETMGFDYTTNDVPGCPQGGVLSGTDGQDDLLYAGVGEDEVRGLGGDDELWGGADGDVMYGGPGSDLLESSGKRSGDRSKDVLYGGEGGDTMFGDEGEDVLYGEDGDDFLGGAFDGRQRDKLYCGEGRDTVLADWRDYVDSSCEGGSVERAPKTVQASEVLSGTDKADYLDGGGGDDEIHGFGSPDAQADELLGGDGRDVLYGGAGLDFVYGEQGDDVLYGGDRGDILLVGGKGEDVIYGGDGNDNIEETGDGQRDKLYCGEGRDDYSAEKIDYVDSSCEKGTLVDTGGAPLIFPAGALLLSAGILLGRSVVRRVL
jgi:Ca2+-binding RTX toxin-like protein